MVVVEKSFWIQTITIQTTKTGHHKTQLDLTMFLSSQATRLSSQVLRRAPSIVSRKFSQQAPKKDSPTNYIWHVGTVAALGLTYVGVNKAIEYSLEGDEDDAISEGPVQPQAEITTRVYFDVEIDSNPAGRIVMGLHGNVVPKTVHNFKTLCAGNETHPRGAKLAYEGSIFHRVIPGFMLQGGDFTNFNGTGGISVYGDKFADENFQLRHTGPGLLSMANAGKNTNGSQFFITTARTPHLDGRHVVFGVVESGWDVVKRIESFGSRSGTPSRKIVIKKAGVLGEEEAN